MTSGIPGNSNNLPDNIFSKFTGKQYFNKIDPDKILQLTHEYPLHFKPGTQYEYSNANYVLLGRFINKITHHSPEFEIKKRIINPLDLKNTYFVVDKEDETPEININQLVHGYAFQSKKSKPYPFLPYGADTLHYSLSYANTAGAMASTPDDINIFLHSIFQKNGLFNKYQKQMVSLVSRKTGKPIKSLSEKDKQGWGFGVIGYYWNKSHPLIYIYNGTTDGFQFAWLMDPINQSYLSLAINSHADILGLDDALKMFQIIDDNCRN
jgi:D-alanyl-D-alanine carboxypeptidase